ncbi:MAG TPA: hypothetical protein VD769_10605 [Gaiellaceae bacterium]|nr:hypothetical protein [Gaiellaceae bacterium]
MDPHPVARRVGAGAALAFLVVLFFPWHEVSVEIGGAVSVSVTSSGWGGWGIAAGLFAALLAGILVARPRWETFAAPLLGLGLAVAAVLELVGGRATVEEPPASVAVHSGLWAAWLGVGLALVAGLASLAPLLDRAGRQAGVAPHSP